jgi:hypothetical protein
MKPDFRRLSLVAALVVAAACASSTPPVPPPAPVAAKPDPREGLSAGLMNAGEAVSGLRITAKAASPPGFLGITNSDLAFTGNYAIQGNYNGPVVWDVSNPNNPVMVTAYQCPASQNDVSVFKNLMFMSAEAYNGRLDCGTGGTGTAPFGADSVNAQRFRGVRVFDITDIKNPKLVANVQTCRGSHTHTVVEDVKDPNNVYIYVSGSAPIRSGGELSRCVSKTPDQDPSSSLMKIEIIKVPLANPSAAAVVNTANIFEGLKFQASHAPSSADLAAQKRAVDSTRRVNPAAFIAINPQSKLEFVVNPGFIRNQLDSVMRARGGTPSVAPAAPAHSSADTAALRPVLQTIVDRAFAPNPNAPVTGAANPVGRQCHDITVYPSKGLAGGACEGHGFLIDISDIVNPKRLYAVSDSNFAYWHSATFNNDGTKMLFSDEWGGGGGPKCREGDPKEFGADAIFTITPQKTLQFESYYKLPAKQTDKENCVAHNGSLVPIPGRDVMIQSWYQGGISMFDWTDPKNPKEIAFFDRGPVDSLRAAGGGSWSVYWYNGAIVSSEIARGLDVAEMIPTEHVTQNEIDAAKTVKWSQLNAQGQPEIKWPPSYALAKAYTDQLERHRCLPANRIATIRSSIATAESATGQTKTQALNTLASSLEGESRNSCDGNKANKLRDAVISLQNAIVP